MLKTLKKRKYILLNSNMSRKSWACVSGHTFFIILNDPPWIESDRWLYRDNSCSRELGGQIGRVCNEVQTGFWHPILPPQWLEFLTRPCWDCWYGDTLSAAWGRYTGITLVLEKKWYTYVIHAKNRKYMLFSSNMSRKSWAWVSGLTLFIISSDAKWMESDRCLYRDNSCSRELEGGQDGGWCNEVQTGFWPPILPPQRLEFLTRPCWDCWYGNTLSAALGRYTGITLVLERKVVYLCYTR